MAAHDGVPAIIRGVPIGGCVDTRLAGAGLARSPRCRFHRFADNSRERGLAAHCERNALPRRDGERRRVLVGFALSTAVAIPLGLAIGCSRVLKAVFGPIVSIIRPLPSLSWIPLSMMWLGIGESQKIRYRLHGDCRADADLRYRRCATRRPGSDTGGTKSRGGPGSRPVGSDTSGALPSNPLGAQGHARSRLACIISAEMVGATSGLGFLIWNAKDWANISQSSSVC